GVAGCSRQDPAWLPRRRSAARNSKRRRQPALAGRRRRAQPRQQGDCGAKLSSPDMEYRDYYAALGVPRTASAADIKKAFRKLARQHHPDVNKGDAAAEQRFKEISEANEVLSDPEKRKLYDQLGANWQAYQQAGASGATGARPGQTADP